jgi:hypothetical protein
MLEVQNTTFTWQGQLSRFTTMLEMGIRALLLIAVTFAREQESQPKAR